MAESFFGFDTTSDRDRLDNGTLSDEDEEDYDALNDETFGGDAALDPDWEENHEKLAEITELSRHGHSENGDFEAQIAAFILDDEPDLLDREVERLDFSLPRTPRPPPGFGNVTNNNHLSSEVNIPIAPYKKFISVEELEKNLIQPPPATSLRLEDIERGLIPKSHNQQLVSFHSHQHAPGFTSVPSRPFALLSASLTKLPPPLPIPVPIPPHITHPLLQGGGPLQAGPPGVYKPPHLRLGPMRSLLPPPPRLPPPPIGDEYAGLMNQREKQWLASIQMIQLPGNNPYQDDYYYMMYQVRQSGAHGRKGNVKLAREPPNSTKSTYTPLQFENSLGKLQAGSVMAPRKIIDTDIVESIDTHSSTTSSKKFKQILLEIEHLFSTILMAEEALSPLTANTVENVNPTEIFSKAVSALLKDDKLRTVLSIRKGKNLVLRILPHTDVSDPLSERLITVLPTVARRDHEQSLLRALPAIRHYLASASLVSLNTLSMHLLPHLPTLLENKLGISVIANMIERAEALMTFGVTDGSAAWLIFLTSIVSTSSEVPTVERPVVGIQGPVLARHLARLPPSSHAAILQKAISNTAFA